MAYLMFFPYTDMYQMNLDWLLDTVKRLEQSIGDEVVNSFNQRSGAVELTAEDVNALMIESVYIGNPGEDITDITPAELQEMYSAGKRMLLLRDNDGLARQLYLLDIVGETATATKYIPDISTDVVTTFNNRSGQVALLASDVNGTRIDITWISDPGDSISDLSQDELDEMYNNGIRVMVFVNNLGSPDQLYFLVLVNNVVTPQAYSPDSSESGVLSVNGRTGAVILYANNITLRSGVLETVDGALSAIRNSIGTLSSLTTDDKTSVVAAINEVDSSANSAASAAATAQTAAINAASAAATAQSTADGAVTAAGAAQTTANNAATAAATAQSTADAAVQSAANVAADLGDIGDLETPVTTDVVEAVNSLNDQIGNLASLATTSKTSAVSAINEVNSQVVVNTYSITPLNNTVFNTYSSFTRIGKLCVITAFASNSSLVGASNTQVDIGQLPTEMLPPSYVPGLGVYTNGGNRDNHAVKVVITPQGIIFVAYSGAQLPTETSGGVSFTIAYIAKN